MEAALIKINDGTRVMRNENKIQNAFVHKKYRAKFEQNW